MVDCCEFILPPHRPKLKNMSCHHVYIVKVFCSIFSWWQMGRFIVSVTEMQNVVEISGFNFLTWQKEPKYIYLDHAPDHLDHFDHLLFPINRTPASCPLHHPATDWDLILKRVCSDTKFTPATRFDRFPGFIKKNSQLFRFLERLVDQLY